MASYIYAFSIALCFFFGTASFVYMAVWFSISFVTWDFTFQPDYFFLRLMVVGLVFLSAKSAYDITREAINEDH